MIESFSFSKSLVVHVKIWILLAGGAVALLCYNCENEETNSLCSSPDQAVECSPQMDTCQTIVSYSHISNKMAISKTCTKNVSCELQINTTRVSSPCTPKQNTWICTTCCYDDLCNHDNTALCQPNLLLMIFVLIFTFIWRKL